MAVTSERPARASIDRTDLIKLIFVVAGILSFVFSVYLWFAVDRLQGVFVGVWVPSMWSLGALLLAGEQRR
jgi:hypothetical protein